jgi:hypothetical protein
MGKGSAQLGTGHAVEGIDLDKTSFGGVGIEGPNRRGLPCNRSARVAPGIEKGQISAAVTSLDVRDTFEISTVAVVEELTQVASVGIDRVRGETPLVDESPQIRPDGGFGPCR